MADLLIVNSSSEGYDKTETSYPLGLCYLAAAAESRGLSVGFFDSYREPWSRARGRFEALLRELRPAVAGFSCLSFNRNSTRDAARMVKLILPGTLTVCGGPHATPMQEQILRHYDVDVVVRGEGEETLPEVVEAFKGRSPLSAVRGIGYKADGGVRVTPDRAFIADLDSLPLPKHDLYAGKIGAEGRAYVISTRGCPGRCHFCVSTLQLGRRYRMRSAENVMTEIKELYGKYGIRTFGFQDDALTLNRGRTLEFCERMASAGLPVKWSASTRANAFDAEMAAMMYRAGCRHVAFGVESGSEKLLRAMNKRIMPERVVEAFRAAHEAGLSTGILLIVGTPGESWSTVMETVRLVRRLKPSYVRSVALLQVFPGTHWYEYCRSRGYLDDEYWLSARPVPYYTFEHSELALSFYGFFITFASQWHSSPLRGTVFLFTAIYKYAPRIAKAVLKLFMTIGRRARRGG
ncbi:MAG: radical SAM protein [bacterium]